MLEEARKRNHVKLGTQLELFSTYEEVGAGMVVWHPNGAMLRHIFWRTLRFRSISKGAMNWRGARKLLKTDLVEKIGAF